MRQKHIQSLIGVLLILGWAGSASLLYSDVTLAVPEKFQEHSNWCWAGCSEAILNYHNQYPSQCEIANFTLSTERCCDGSYDFIDMVKGCNKPNFLYGSDGSIEDILANWGVGSVGMYAPMDWSTSILELDSGYPFVMRWGWTTGGGHFLVGYGYISDGSYLKYMNPWPGEGYTTSLFTYVVSAPDHEWTHTLTTL